MFNKDDYIITYLFIFIRTFINFTGSTKLFPLVVTYFDINEGIKHRLLDFYEDDYESSEAFY